MSPFASSLFDPGDKGSTMDRLKQRIARSMKGKDWKRTSLLDGLPLGLSALERAQRLSERASQVGFDWPNAEAVWKKIGEELAELKRADRKGPRKAIEEEIGDLLFTIVNWARLKNLAAEEALRKANRRFMKRFHQVELELHRRGKTLEESSLKEMDRIWDEVKRKRESNSRRALRKRNQAG